MVEFIQEAIESMGYIGIAALMFLENIFPPIPSELIMPFAGFTAHQGDELTFVGIVIAGTVGTVLGALPIYALGYYFGLERLQKLTARYGHWFGVKVSDLDKAQDWVNKYGYWAVLVCRCIPGIRTLISIPAGLSGMRFIPFLIYSTIGAAIWTTFLAYLGVLLGENYDKVETYIGPLSYVVVGAIGVAGLVWIIQRKRQETRLRQQERLIGQPEAE